MTPEQEDALVEQFWKLVTGDGDENMTECARRAIRAAYAQAVAQERERCTKSCLATIKGGPTTGEDFRAITAIQNCAAAIRRGE